MAVSVAGGRADQRELRGAQADPRELRGAQADPRAAQLTRYRKAQINERQREANRLRKILEDTAIKLDCVASDILVKAGRSMLDALVAGTTDPVVLVDLAKGKLRAKIAVLTEALEGRFDGEHALVVAASHVDFLDEQITLLSDAPAEKIVPFENAVELLCTIPGEQRRTAEVMIAEIGADMSVFPSAGRVASWAGLCPSNDKSAGKRPAGTRARARSGWTSRPPSQGSPTPAATPTSPRSTGA